MAARAVGLGCAPGADRGVSSVGAGPGGESRLPGAQVEARRARAQSSWEPRVSPRPSRAQ